MALELYIKVKASPRHAIRASVEQLVNSARHEPGLTRCDWFCHESQAEYVGMLGFADERALLGHLTTQGPIYAALQAAGEWRCECLGQPPEAVREALVGWRVRYFRFALGKAAQSAAGLYRRTAGAALTPHLEIYTRFLVREDRLAAFMQTAQELVEIVKRLDPGTSRYDWFMADDTPIVLAMDTYDDPASMFAHMRNAHDVHEHLMPDATVETEFLGELPAEAAERVARYSPHVLRFVAGLSAHSGGGFR